MRYLPIIIGAIIAIIVSVRGVQLPVEVDPIPPVVTVAPTPTPTPTPAKHEIIAYIAKVFEPAGTGVVVRAINCFYSESGLRWDATHINTNNTMDGGVAQINDCWKMTIDQRLDYKQNIDKAYKIYQGRGDFSAWYAVGCQ